MINVSLKEFLQTGHFGPICLDMRQEHVLELIGEAEDKGIPRKGEFLVWKYGDIEFHFGESPEGKLHLIFTDSFEGVPKGGSTIQIDPWILHQGITQQEVQEQLIKDSIAYYLIEPLHDENQTILFTEAGVQLQFINEPELYVAPPGLAVISCSTHLPYPENLAGIPHVSPKIIQRLYLTKNSKVWLALANNPQTPVELLLQLSAVKEIPLANKIRSAASKNLETRNLL